MSAAKHLLKLGAAAVIYTAVTILVLGFLATLHGCATGECIPPIERAADHGMPLECHPGRKEGTTDCVVSTPKGDQVYTYRRSCQ